MLIIYVCGQALELRNEDRNCLVARSRCYLQMGDTENALRDAESSMEDEPSFFKVGCVGKGVNEK